VLKLVGANCGLGVICNPNVLAMLGILGSGDSGVPVSLLGTRNSRWEDPEVDDEFPWA
jgi:hypothetical protein